MATAVDLQTPSAERRRELATFLRSRRERISPEQVGLPVVGRRRTPGLRREEVASLAAVGVTWYTWLEQGRDIQVSVQVLDAVARALLLDRNERSHLFTLAGSEDPVPVKECATVSPAVRSMVEQLDPFPAVVISSRFDILAYNRAYTWLTGDLDVIPEEDRNIMWMLFTDTPFARNLADCAAARAGVVARFRTAMADHAAEPSWKSLVGRLLKVSPDFREAWELHEVSGLVNGLKQFVLPEVGPLRFEYTNLWLGPRTGTRLIGYVPQDAETRARLQQLAAGA
ncbi:helix-turn-helix transcriptional regulator [Kitasatospora sp. NPDC049285]|uniref:helix-turn-helix transcriptional regulator n=1 Tax=Kitasatospora sp. NPDC049285 TaxID=3157096 RepID=UPI00343D59ED